MAKGSNQEYKYHSHSRAYVLAAFVLCSFVVALCSNGKWNGTGSAEYQMTTKSINQRIPLSAFLLLVWLAFGWLPFLFWTWSFCWSQSLVVLVLLHAQR
jgi:fatty acid desaturase